MNFEHCLQYQNETKTNEMTEENLNKFLDIKDFKNEINKCNSLQYICLFSGCNKEFKNYSRWKLHYYFHVKIFILNLILNVLG